jgi:hypothetical protein
MRKKCLLKWEKRQRLSFSERDLEERDFVWQWPQVIFFLSLSIFDDLIEKMNSMGETCLNDISKIKWSINATL